MFRVLIATIALALFSHTALASAELQIADGWARASIPGTENGAAYGLWQNTGDTALTLTHLTSPVANKTELHQHQHADGMMKMVHVKSLAIAAGEKVTLKPGGYHIMLFGVKEPLKAGESFQVKLHYQSGATQLMDVQVRSH